MLYTLICGGIVGAIVYVLWNPKEAVDGFRRIPIEHHHVQIIKLYDWKREGWL